MSVLFTIVFATAEPLTLSHCCRKVLNQHVAPEDAWYDRLTTVSVEIYVWATGRLLA